MFHFAAYKSYYLLSQEPLLVFVKGSAHGISLWGHQQREAGIVIFVLQEAFVSLGFLFLTAIGHLTILFTKRGNCTQFISKENVLNGREQASNHGEVFYFLYTQRAV